MLYIKVFLTKIFQ